VVARVCRWGKRGCSERIAATRGAPSANECGARDSVDEPFKPLGFAAATAAHARDESVNSVASHGLLDRRPRARSIRRNEGAFWRCSPSSNLRRLGTRPREVRSSHRIRPSGGAWPGSRQIRRSHAPSRATCCRATSSQTPKALAVLLLDIHELEARVAGAHRADPGYPFCRSAGTRVRSVGILPTAGGSRKSELCPRLLAVLGIDSKRQWTMMQFDLVSEWSPHP
jgi:hypothetical protein